MSVHLESICHTLPEHKTWLRTGEVACYLDISKSSVFRLRQKGKIPARCFGYSVRILRADILAFENGARTIRLAHIILHGCLEQAKRLGLIHRNPTEFSCYPQAG